MGVCIWPRSRVNTYILSEFAAAVSLAFQQKECPGVSWMIGCFGSHGSLRHYFSLFRAVSQRKGERTDK